MKHFAHISEQEREKLFLAQPEEIDFFSEKDLLATALGATLYIPTNRTNLTEDVLKMGRRGTTSVVLCLEDAIADHELTQGENNLMVALRELSLYDPKSLPAIFVRVRTPEHLSYVGFQNIDHLDVLTGFVLPKFEHHNERAEEFVKALEVINDRRRFEDKRPLYFMPVLESENLVYGEQRHESLQAIAHILEGVKDSVLAVRIGATDMSSAYSLRRSRDFTIYNVGVIASAIGDIVNYFGRATGGYIISGAVWEHFPDRERLFKSQLRATPFTAVHGEELRDQLLLEDLDGLIKEVELDRINKIQGKTVIHPTHIALVNAMNVVTHEEYSDALDVTSVERANGGAVGSSYRNKMNEQKPHYNWGVKTLLRARAFGVANEEITFVDILKASMKSMP